jgi:serpin B
MTKAGATGASDAVLAKLLHLTGEQAASPHTGFASLRAAVEDRAQQGGHELLVANHLWSRTGWRVQENFAKTLRDHYAADLSLLDFGKPAEAAVVINDLVRANTANKIASVVRPELFNDRTRLVLASAIYFKGLWQQPFEAEARSDAPFETPGGTINTPTMYQQEIFGYAEDEGLQILEMAYSPGSTSMVILLPRKADGALAKLERRFSAEQVANWLKSMHPCDVKVYVPRFRFDAYYDLHAVLDRLGAGSLFKPDEGPFGAMIEGENLWLGFLLHRAYVDVNEEGTEAAAATAGGAFGGAGQSPPPVPIFRADHPFVFLIRDVRTGCILFLGRVVDPSKGA